MGSKLSSLRALEHGVLALGCTFGGLAGAPAAEESPPDVSGTAGGGVVALTMTVENDSFAFVGSDNNYTNGIGFSWSTDEVGTFDEKAFTAKWSRFWSFLPFVGDEGYATYAAWTVGQQMHTPDDISVSNPPLDDQPYAGVLYVDSALHARREGTGHTFSLRAGIVGPSSHAEQIQTEWHELVGATEPQGWDTQLPDELLLNATYSVQRVWRAGELGPSVAWRAVPLAAVSAGNFFTGAGGGLYAEIGWHLPDAFARTSLREGFTAASTVGAGSQRSWSLSFFAGLGAYGVLHYLPLDGTVFEDSRSVDSNPLIGAVSGGVSFRWRRLVLSASHSYFSESFETERERTEFGTFSLSWYLARGGDRQTGTK